MKESIKRYGKKAAASVLIAAALFLLFDLIFPVETSVEYAPVVEARDGTILYSFLTKDEQWRMKARLDEITPELKKAIIYKEDKYFYHHWGINPLAIGRAVINNIFYLKRTSGASTITMQVARMLNRKERTYLNKILEMFRALQLELHYSKEEILQLYLNLVPYGSNIQGVKAASVLYFDKTPDQLSLAELTALSIIPNRPNSLVMGKDNDLIIKQRNKWLLRFKKDKLFPDNTIQDALGEPLTAFRHQAPRSAPQLAHRIRLVYPSLPEIRTTIDAKKQVIAEEIVASYMDGLKLQGIHNASVLIIDNRTREVISYIGSSDHHDKLHNGQVDGIIATRSPGSTLKPLLYGLCFDKGWVTPKSTIADVPINMKGYTPENYDLAFRGNVTIESALQQSLNIPAVKLLDQLGVKTFASALTEAGFRSIWQSRKKIGMSMILGGCGVRLEELTALYASFANDGQYLPLEYVMADSMLEGSLDGTKYSGTPIISRGANYLLTRTLMDLHRPDLPNLYDQATNIPRIAWKTGTSYGRKDAWSIGYNKHYTIGIWIGNFNGQGVTALNGAGTATPLLFRLFNAIDRRASEEWLTQPQDIGFRLVCSQSGHVPDDHCTDQVMDYYLPGISQSQRCQHLKEVYLSADEHESYCVTCLPLSGYKVKNYTNISAELTAYYEASHISFDKIPPHNSSCSRLFEGEAPVINSLTNNMTYIIADKGKQQLQLSCTAANDVQQVYWYVNDKFLKTTGIGQKLFFNPESQELKISCTDDKGRNRDIHVKIKFI